MPQMMPLNWMLLMSFFIILFIMINSLNYFNKIYNKSYKFDNNSKTFKIWKW
uniref:ATP synthase complex subunit 8 n=1 Tax=Ptiliidae sp. BMNH 1274723 TaxID=1796536 RepID=A0A126TG90_9COLE|nr:ATP synthase F0 subunit 8 [Ptiliidae sp. BMNH 1274723]